jgi:hypothetical protein
MFIRLATADIHERSTRPMGVIQVAYRLRDRGVFNAPDVKATRPSAWGFTA